MSKRTSHPNREALPKKLCRIPDGYGIVKIGVSGAAELDYLGLGVLERAREVGREIARQGAIITTGATTGFPFYAAQGAKDECGLSIGFSPASTEAEHVGTYDLPLEYMDVVVYSGFGYSGRNLLLVRSSDAVVIGPGRIGTLNEFTVAFEDRKPIGILEGDWDTDELLKRFIESSRRPHDHVIYDNDAKRLIERLIEMVQNRKRTGAIPVYNNYDGYSATAQDAQPIL